MSLGLLVSAILKMLIGFLLLGVLIFLPAGTFLYPNGWLLLGTLFVPMVIAAIVLMITSPQRLEKRLRSKEASKQQQLVILGSAGMFIAGFLLAGVGVRFGWYQLPCWVSVVASIVFLAAYGLYGLVIRQNPYLSRVVEVCEDHKLIDSGCYALVRHPMYSATLGLFLAMPLMLGSLYSFFVFLIYPVLIAKRISHEEAFLKKELPGYQEYCEKVKYRLIPFIW